MSDFDTDKNAQYAGDKAKTNLMNYPALRSRFGEFVDSLNTGERCSEKYAAGPVMPSRMLLKPSEITR